MRSQRHQDSLARFGIDADTSQTLELAAADGHFDPLPLLAICYRHAHVVEARRAGSDIAMHGAMGLSSEEAETGYRFQVNRAVLRPYQTSADGWFRVGDVHGEVEIDRTHQPSVIAVHPDLKVGDGTGLELGQDVHLASSSLGPVYDSADWAGLPAALWAVTISRGPLRVIA